MPNTNPLNAYSPGYFFLTPNAISHPHSSKEATDVESLRKCR